MNLAELLEHWNLAENPFRGEEARHDAVFARMDRTGATHADFGKILGDPATPSSSIVFGEKGSGKTAIRLQIESRLRGHNEANPDRKTLLIPYDDLNWFLDELHARTRRTGKGNGNGGKAGDPDRTLSRIRLVDHLDAILAIGVTRLCDAALGEGAAQSRDGLGQVSRRTARSAPIRARRAMLRLQAVYDRRDTDGERTARLQPWLGLGRRWSELGWVLLIALGWAPAVAMIAWWMLSPPSVSFARDALPYAAGVLGALYLLAIAKHQLWDRAASQRHAAKIKKQLRGLTRPAQSIAGAIRVLSPRERSGLGPTVGAEETRFAALGDLGEAASVFGYTGMVVVIDRVDEPTLIAGDPERMRSFVWPLMNNKFLQSERFGVKMLLPIELRYALLRESSSFFQEARLDKQNMVERLGWTGATMYDLCNARLAACARNGSDPVQLLDLFAEDVTRQDIVDALEQMGQPRDAFKFLYRCLSEHCSNVTADQNAKRVPRLILETVRRQESERVQQLQRGIRPA